MGREGDVVLIYYEEKPAVFARIEWIAPDVRRGWYQVGLLFLTLPTQTATWILREDYIKGGPFTMGGKAVRLEEVARAETPDRDHETAKSNGDGGAGKGKVIPFKRS
jgi:hypothetical protein